MGYMEWAERNTMKIRELTRDRFPFYSAGRLSLKSALNLLVTNDRSGPTPSSLSMFMLGLTGPLYHSHGVKRHRD